MLCLIVLPICVFLFGYVIHFKVLNSCGDGDKHMSTEFLYTLKGNNITNLTRAVYFDSVIKFKSKTEKSYLHSHKHLYPESYGGGRMSSGGQQVTGYHHPDENNDWIIIQANSTTDFQANVSTSGQNKSRVIVKDGDIIRLKHVITGKYLISYDNIPSPATAANQEVSAASLQDENDEKYPHTLWKVEMSKGEYELYSKISLFKLRHVSTGTILRTAHAKLPDWGYKQNEISAGILEDNRAVWTVDMITSLGSIKKWKQPLPQHLLKMKKGMIHTTEEEVEENANEEIDYLPEQSEEEKQKAVAYLEQKKPGFFKKFAEYFAVQVEANNRLIEEGPPETTPAKWPLLVHGQPFWGSKEGDQKVYLLGNPFSWYLAFFSTVTFVGLLICDVFCLRRNVPFLNEQQRNFLYEKGCYFLLCYVLHYLPFFVMGRILYFHHYLPSYLFSALVFASLYQVLAIRYKVLNSKVTIGVIAFLIIAFWTAFSCLSYATPQTPEYFKSLQWRERWNW